MLGVLLIGSASGDVVHEVLATSALVTLSLGLGAWRQRAWRGEYSGDAGDPGGRRWRMAS